jgi:hypothetical protein
MFRFRLVLLLTFFALMVACTSSDVNEEPATVAVTQPTATAVPIEPTAAPTETPVEVTSETNDLATFVEQLQTAVANQDYTAMQAAMSDPIAVGGWRSEWRMYEPNQTVAEFQSDALPAPLAVLFSGLSDEELTDELGQTPASMFGPQSNVVTALHTTGWGQTGNDEAILFVTEQDGDYKWSAFLYTFGSFAQNDTANSDPHPFVETDVNHVMAQQDVVIYSGPGETYDEIGGIFDGQTALVTGQSEDGNWWRVICPDDTIGDCWVAADPASTIPTDGAANQTRLIMTEPLFTGGDLQFAGWSHDGRHLAYFEYTEEQVASAPFEGLRGSYPGTFVFYDTQTGEKCKEYPFSGFFPTEGPGGGRQWRWLPDGQLLLNLPDGQLLQTEAPCTAGENIAPLFPTPIASFGDFSPDERWLVLVGAGQYLLYDWSTRNTHPVAEVQPDEFKNLVWSPDSQHISITLAGDYTGDRSPIGGTRVIDAATGEIVARYDWEPANALDGTFGGPVWVSNEEFVVTLSLDQGPFLMDIFGEVQPLLPFFDETLEQDDYWPPLDVFADIENDRYAILRGNEGREGPAKLYIATPEGESIEIFERTSNTFRILPDGTVGYEANGVYWTRPVFEIEATFSERPAYANPWMRTDSQLIVSPSGSTVSIYDFTSGELIERLQVEGYEVNFRLIPFLSPNDQWLAIFVTESNYGFGKALFIVPAIDN